jgi:hypothetical protein
MRVRSLRLPLLPLLLPAFLTACTSPPPKDQPDDIPPVKSAPISHVDTGPPMRVEAQSKWDGHAVIQISIKATLPDETVLSVSLRHHQTNMEFPSLTRHVEMKNGVAQVEVQDRDRVLWPGEFQVNVKVAEDQPSVLRRRIPPSLRRLESNVVLMIGTRVQVCMMANMAAQRVLAQPENVKTLAPMLENLLGRTWNNELQDMAPAEWHGTLYRAGRSMYAVNLEKIVESVDTAFTQRQETGKEDWDHLSSAWSDEVTKQKVLLGEFEKLPWQVVSRSDRMEDSFDDLKGYIDLTGSVLKGEKDTGRAEQKAGILCRLSVFKQGKGTTGKIKACSD